MQARTREECCTYGEGIANADVESSPRATSSTAIPEPEIHPERIRVQFGELRGRRRRALALTMQQSLVGGTHGFFLAPWSVYSLGRSVGQELRIRRIRVDAPIVCASVARRHDVPIRRTFL